jgi:hypothetical protein
MECLGSAMWIIFGMTGYIVLTAIGLTHCGSITVHIYTLNNTQNNTMEQNTQNGTFIAIRTLKHNNKNTKHNNNNT